MALEISTVGAKVKYIKKTGSSRPTSGYSVLPDVNTAPELNLTPETLDASNIGDLVTRYIPGRLDAGGDLEFTLNHTENAISTWNAMADGSTYWFEYCYPNATNSFYFACTPQQLGTNGIEQNAVSTIPAHAIFSEFGGWATASTNTSV